MTLDLSKQHYRERRRADRLQRKRGGGWQLPSARGGPLIMQQVNDPNYAAFNKDIGFRVRKNKKNKFCVIFWHYTEDPEKRDPAYERDGREQNPQGWDQEMELDFQSKKGIRVFSEFPWSRAECDMGPYWSSKSNVILPGQAPPDWWSLYLCTDPGRRAAWATLFILVDEFGCWHVWKSIVRRGMHYSEAKPLIAGILGRRHPVEHVIDPASRQQRTDSLYTLLQKMAAKPYPMDCIPVDHLGNEFIEIEELRERMMRRPDGRYGMYFWDTDANQECIRQFKNTTYKDDKGEKILSEDVDSVDAAKYLATRMINVSVRPRKPRELMTPEEYRADLTRLRLKRLHQSMTAKQAAIDSGEEQEYRGSEYI